MPRVKIKNNTMGAEATKTSFTNTSYTPVNVSMGPSIIRSGSAASDAWRARMAAEAEAKRLAEVKTISLYEAGKKLGHYKDFKQYVEYVDRKTNKIEAEIKAMKNALTNVEKGLKSTDMRSQGIIDGIAARTKHVDNSLKSINKFTTQIESDLKAVVAMANSNRTGVSSFSNRLDVHADEFEKKIHTSEEKLNQRIAINMSTLQKKDQVLTAQITGLTATVKENYAVADAFRKEVLKRNTYVDEQITNFTNSIESNKNRSTENVNRLNDLSADFSNHVGDYKSHIKSFETHQDDFSSYKDQHKQVHEKQNADFKDLTMKVNANIADFANHEVDYKLHKKPWAVRQAQARASMSKTGLYNIKSAKQGKITSKIAEFLSKFKRKK